MSKHGKSRIEIATPEDVERYAKAAPDDGESAAPGEEVPRTEAAHPPADEQGEAPAPEQVEAPALQAADELAGLKDQLLRAKAEQQNILKRTANERIEAVKYANVAFAKSLLGSIDDLERTIEHSAEADRETLLAGVRLVHDNLLKALQEHNIEIIDPVGAPFDPRFHEAVMQQEADAEPGTVVQVLQRGYKLQDRVVRPAKVIIAKGADE